MKAYQIKELEKFVSKKDIANLFHVYKDNNLDIKNNRVFNIMRSVYFADLSDIPLSYFKYYTVIKNDNWNLISYKLYGTIELFWLLMKLNGVIDPFYEPIVGKAIRYISKDDANGVVEKIKTQ